MNRIPLKVSQWSRVVQLAQNAQSQSRGGWHPSRAVISFLPPSQNYPVWFPNLPPEGVLAGISLFPEIKSFGMFAPSQGGTCGSSLPDASPCSHSTTFPLSLQMEKEDNNNIKILIPLGWRIWDGEEGFYLVFTGREKPPHPSHSTEQEWELCSEPRKEIASPVPTPGKPLINISTNFEALSNLEKLEWNKSCLVVRQRFQGRWIRGRWEVLQSCLTPFWLGVTAVRKCHWKNVPLPMEGQDGTPLGCWRCFRDIPPRNANNIPKNTPSMRAALTSPGKCEVLGTPSSIHLLRM